MKKYLVGIIMGIFFIILFLHNSESQVKEKYSNNILLGFVSDKGEIYIETEFKDMNSLQKWIQIEKTFVPGLDRSISILDPNKITPLIKVGLKQEYDIYYEDGFLTTGGITDFVSCYNLPGGGFYIYAKIAGKVTKKIDNNVIIAIPHSDKNKKEVTIGKLKPINGEFNKIIENYLNKLIDTKYADAGQIAKKETTNYLVDINGDKSKEYLVTGNWTFKKESSRGGYYNTYLSVLFYFSGNKINEEAIKYILPNSYSAGDTTLKHKLIYSLDLDGDGWLEFVVKNLLWEGEAYSLVKWYGKEYQRIYTSYYFGA